MKAQYIRAMDAIHRACLFVAGACLVIITHHRPLGRVHPLRAQQRRVMARADGRAADDRAVVPVGGRLLPRISAHRRRHPAGALLGEPAQGGARLVPRDLHARHQSVHAVVGHQAGADDLAPEHRGIPARLGRHVLPADPDRRRAHRAVRHRALPDAESSSRSRRPRPSARSRPSNETRGHGRPHSGRQLRRRVPAGHAGRLRARPRRHPRPRCGSAFRSKP